MIDVLVVDDSPVVRAYLAYLLEGDPALRATRTAANGQEAVASVRAHKPDLVLMDLHMPVMDGLEATRRIMAWSPVPIVLITASTGYQEVATAMEALQVGALAVLKKPGGLGDPDAPADAAQLLKTVKLMAQVAVVGRRYAAPSPAPRPSGPAVLRDLAVVALGASTGGPPALMALLARLGGGFPAPLLVVQHMAPGFTAGFAEWLSAGSGLPVGLAVNGERARPGHVYLAPDDLHLRVNPQGQLLLGDDPPHNDLRPSVGVLFRSVGASYGRRAAAVLLSGMGRDGAAELKQLADQGALTLAQDQESSLLFGMPAEAIRLGAANYVGSPVQLADRLRATAGQAV